MKIWVIVFLVILLPSVYAVEISIPELFTVEKVMDTQPSKEIYFYTGNKLIASFDDELKYQYQNRLNSDGESKTLPFGQPILTENRFSFTTKELDDELYYFGARYYNSELGRFNSVDPLLETPYQYVGNNPLAFIDPTGEGEEKPLLLHLEVHPSQDHNGFFAKEYITPDVYENYRVVKVTLTAQNDFFQAIEEVSKEFGPIDLLVYGFHGHPNGLYIADRYLIEGYDEEHSTFNIVPDHFNSWLSTQRILRKGVNSMREHFSEDAYCVGLSCSNAGESEWAITPNVQDSLALVLGIPMQNLVTSEWQKITMNPETGRAEIGSVDYRIYYQEKVEGGYAVGSVFSMASKIESVIAGLKEENPDIKSINAVPYKKEVAKWAYPGEGIANAIMSGRF